VCEALDCFVAALLAMTEVVTPTQCKIITL
jgi:hypothetical protein